MPHYRITVTTRDKTAIGIRQHDNANIDVLYNYFYKKAVAAYGESNIKDFDCVIISRQSNDYIQWMKKKNKTTDDLEITNDQPISRIQSSRKQAPKDSKTLEERKRSAE